LGTAVEQPCESLIAYLVIGCRHFSSPAGSYLQGPDCSLRPTERPIAACHKDVHEICGLARETSPCRGAGSQMPRDRPSDRLPSDQSRASRAEVL
jgi:hypothetical protein